MSFWPLKLDVFRTELIISLVHKLLLLVVYVSNKHHIYQFAKAINLLLPLSYSKSISPYNTP